MTQPLSGLRHIKIKRLCVHLGTQNIGVVARGAAAATAGVDLSTVISVEQQRTIFTKPVLSDFLIEL